MAKMLLLGDEALAMGAVDAGLSIAYGYPGTPSTEIMEYLQAFQQKEGGIHAAWCSNEKTAYEGAMGVSFAGKRSLVVMKHVGLNVAADAFVNSALHKINGGLVLAVADDPGMHSSQNEQDSRFFADFAKIICFEPTNHQEVYDYTVEAFSISEKFHIPVMLRLVTRLSHSRAAIETGKRLAQNNLNKGNRLDWMALPSLSRKNWMSLLDDQNRFLAYSEQSEYNTLKINTEFKDYGIITTGLGRNYYRENSRELENKPSHLHIAILPVPEEKIRVLMKHVDRILVIEEGFPFVERLIKGISPEARQIDGKLNGVLPPAGELNPDIVRKALRLPVREGVAVASFELPGRPPQLCKGCSHSDTFNFINEVVNSCKSSVVTSDIGCYALGALPPYSTVETLLCMGASIGMAKGASEAGHDCVIATIGDGTFIHSGITALIDAVSANVNMTLILMDNSTTAMTGGQDTILDSSQIVKLVEGVGVHREHIKIINPLKKHHEENVRILREEVEYTGLSVIIPQRECIQTLRKHKKG